MSKIKASGRLDTILCYIWIVLVAILTAFNYQLFVVENNFAPAGLNGIATMVQYKTGFSIGYMALIVNIPLCIFSFFFMDRKFSARTLVFCLVYSFAFILIQRIGFYEFQYRSDGHNTIFPVILSGVTSGFVFGVCFRNNASTGGTDIVAKFISYKKPELNFFWVTFIMNSLIAIVSFFVYAKRGADGNLIYNYEPVCLCIMYCFISSFVGDTIIKGSKSASKFTVITTHPDEITAEISKSLCHSVTQLSAVGSYSQEEKSVLLCVVNRHQFVDFMNIIRKYDDTFSYSESVAETIGNFKHIK